MSIYGMKDNRNPNGDYTDERGHLCNDLVVHMREGQNVNIEEHDNVNHPQHYRPGTYETIKVIDAWNLDFCLGNAVKYISRAGKKDPDKRIEDLEKAIWYIQHEIERASDERLQ